MVYNIECVVQWGDDNHPYGMYKTLVGVRATSRRAALDKAVKQMEAWPCYAKRISYGEHVEGNATIVENQSQ